MNFFRMKVNANSDQNQALQLVKQGGGDGIQISDGLCLKSPLDQKALGAAFAEKGVTASLNPVSASTEDLSADEKLFLQS